MALGWAGGLAAAINGWNQAQDQNYERARQAQADLQKQKEFDMRQQEFEQNKQARQLEIEKRKQEKLDEEERRKAFAPVESADGFGVTTADGGTAFQPDQKTAEFAARMQAAEGGPATEVVPTRNFSDGASFARTPSGLIAAAKYGTSLMSPDEQAKRYAAVLSRQGKPGEAAEYLSNYEKRKVEAADAQRKLNWAQTVESLNNGQITQEQAAAKYEQLYPEEVIKAKQAQKIKNASFDLSAGATRWETGPDGQPRIIASAPFAPQRESQSIEFEIDKLALGKLYDSIAAKRKELSDPMVDQKVELPKKKVELANLEAQAFKLLHKYSRQSQADPLVMRKPADTASKTNSEAEMRSSVNGGMGADPKAILREINSATADLAKLKDASSINEMKDYIADLNRQYQRAIAK